MKGDCLKCPLSLNLLQKTGRSTAAAGQPGLSDRTSAPEALRLGLRARLCGKPKEAVGGSRIQCRGGCDHRGPTNDHCDDDDDDDDGDDDDNDDTIIIILIMMKIGLLL